MPYGRSSESCETSIVPDAHRVIKEVRRRLFPPAPLWYDQGSASGNNSVVECDLAKVEVAGSNPVSRSIFIRGASPRRAPLHARSRAASSARFRLR